jgi:hypothetical protein
MPNRDVYTRSCAKCKIFKRVLGGKYINKRWCCADCAATRKPVKEVQA